MINMWYIFIYIFGNNNLGRKDLDNGSIWLYGCFVCYYYGYKSVVLELKCFFMLGIYNGKMGTWKEGMIDWESLKNLNDKLKTETEVII